MIVETVADDLVKRDNRIGGLPRRYAGIQRRAAARRRGLALGIPTVDRVWGLSGVGELITAALIHARTCRIVGGRRWCHAPARETIGLTVGVDPDRASIAARRLQCECF